MVFLDTADGRGLRHVSIGEDHVDATVIFLYLRVELVEGGRIADITRNADGTVSDVLKRLVQTFLPTPRDIHVGTLGCERFGCR